MKKFLKIFAVLLLIALVYLRIEIYPQLDLISGFSAKSVASGHFIDNRSLETIQQGDNDIDKIDWATNEINHSERFVISKVYGLKERKSIYREGLGATLINDDFDISKPYNVPKRTKINTNLPFPYGNLEPKDTVFSNIDYVKLKGVIEDSFDKKGQKDKRTRSVIVIYKNKIIAEKYEDGFNKNSKSDLPSRIRSNINK